MAFLVKDLVLDSIRLPGCWQENIAAIAAEKLHIHPAKISNAEILSASIDSRRGAPKLLLSLKLEGDLPSTPPEEFAAFQVSSPIIPENTTLKHPVVVGTGPAGIFGALILAYAGCEPVIIDRGSPVETRSADYRNFLKTRQLDPDSNLLIGEGGAGTFSDGKLYTGTRDYRAAWVKQIMVQCGAPAEILWQKRAHVGSDYLAIVAAALRKKIESLGGKFLFNTEISSLKVSGNTCTGVITSSGELISAPAVLFAPGLGGRYLVRNILPLLQWSLKPFQIGCRVEHPQELIDRAMYHVPRPAALGAAEYHLVSRKYPRHTASFCMCPGGEVVNATAWEKRSISNGMSLFARDSGFANSCLISTFTPEESGSLADIDRLYESLEKRSFEIGGGDYTLPAQDISAFLRKEAGLKNTTSPAATGIAPGRIDQIIPTELFNSLSSALKDFDRRIPGFIKSGKLIGIESCVSSPIRILRDRETMASSLANLYCSGEGCGLAGGIISAACDGISCSTSLLSFHEKRK